MHAWVLSGGNCSGSCDVALDFDSVLRDPADPNRIDPTIDSGDGIHPTGAGYARLAASVPLDAFN